MNCNANGIMHWEITTRWAFETRRQGVIEVKTWTRRNTAVPRVLNYARLLREAGKPARPLRIHLFDVSKLITRVSMRVCFKAFI